MAGQYFNEVRNSDQELNAVKRCFFAIEPRIVHTRIVKQAARGLIVARVRILCHSANAVDLQKLRENGREVMADNF